MTTFTGGDCARCMEDRCMHGVDEALAEDLARAGLPMPPPTIPVPEEEVAAASEPVPMPALRDPKKPAPARIRRHPLIRFAREWCNVDLHPLQAMHAVAALEATSRMVLLLWGRRGGKSLTAIVIALYVALVDAERHLRHARSNERIGIALVANSERQAGEMMRVLHELIESSPRLRSKVESMTGSVVRFSSRVDVLVLPTSSRTIRGRTLCLVILDELGLAQDGSGAYLSPQAARELIDAIIPSTFSFPEGRVLVTSTPRWVGSTLYEIAQAGADATDPSVHLLHAAAPELRPDIGREVWEEERIGNPARFARETLALWDDGFGGLFDRETVEACLVDRGTLPPVPGQEYVEGVDASGGGGGGDPWATVVVHPEGDRVIVDRIGLRGHDGRPFATDQAVRDDAAVAKVYGNALVLVDNYAGGFLARDFRKEGVQVRDEPWTNAKKWADLQTLRSLAMAGRLEIPKQGYGAELANQLLTVTMTQTATGQPKVGAPPGLHDDLLTALMAAVAAAVSGRSGGKVQHGPSPWNF